MSLTSQQSQQLYGTTAYTGWGESEASADARTKGLSGGGGGGFNFESEVDKAFSELGKYYTELLDQAQGDLDLALSRLQEDYDTGKRYRREDFNLSSRALNIAQQAFSTDAVQAFKTLETRNLQRGISRQSGFAPTEGRGIADIEQGQLQERIDRGQQGLDIRGEELTGGLARADEQSLTQKSRIETDLPEQLRRQKVGLEEERKLQAGNIALSRQQRAANRFDAGLI